MEITYQLTEEDYLDFNLFAVKNSKTAMRSLKFQQFFPPILYIIFAFVISKVDGTPFLYSFIVFLIVAIIWFIFYPKYFYNTINRRIKKMLKEGKNNNILGEHLMELNEEGVRESSPKGEEKANWASIIDFQENAEYLFLFNSSFSAFILPKRELKDVEEIRNYIRSRLTLR